MSCPGKVFSGKSEDHCWHTNWNSIHSNKTCCICGKVEEDRMTTYIHLGGSHGTRDANLVFKRMWGG